MLDPYISLAPLFLLPIAGMLRFIGCGEAFSSLPERSLNIEPESADLFPHEQQQFTALENGTTVIVIWSGSPNLTSDGLYTAPDPFDPGLEYETVTASDGTGLNASAQVTLKPGSNVKVTPDSVSLAPGDVQLFTADVDVDWTIDPPVYGTVISTGPNTANYTFDGPFKIGLKPVRVRATSTDSSATGKATVTLIGNAAEFVPPPDIATLGTWKGTYGDAGWALAGAPPDNLPPFLPLLDTASLVVFTFVDPTTDPRGLQKPPSLATRFAAAWFDANVLTLEFDFNDYKTHRVAFYCIDWTQQGRAQTFEFSDTSQAPPQVLDTQTLSNFEGGQYLIWDLAGKVLLKAKRTAGPNAVISGIFFQ